MMVHTFSNVCSLFWRRFARRRLQNRSIENDVLPDGKPVQAKEPAFLGVAVCALCHRGLHSEL